MEINWNHDNFLIYKKYKIYKKYIKIIIKHL